MSNIIIKTTTNNNPVPIPISPGGDFTEINNASFFEYCNDSFTEIIITLDTAGTYFLSQQILAKCNFTLIATVPGVIIEAKSDTGTFPSISNYDESIIKIVDSHKRGVSATIKNITFKFTDTKISRENYESEYALAGYYFFKFEDLSSVTFENVHMELNTPKLTNIIMKGSSNILVTGCTINNLTTELLGGSLWVRTSDENNEISNINIINNTFHKYGNDEAIGVWTYIPKNNPTGNAISNVLISRNTIEYSPKDTNNSNPAIASNDVLVKIYCEGTNVRFDNETGCAETSSFPENYEFLLENIEISNNIFHIKDLVRKIVSLWSDGYVSTRNITVKNNTTIIENINFAQFNSNGNSYNVIGAYAINDALGTNLEVEFSHNTIISKCIFPNGSTPTVEALSIYGGHTRFNDNTIFTQGGGEIIGISIRNNPGITSSNPSTDNNETASIICQNQVKLELRNNIFDNLYLLGSFSYKQCQDFDNIDIVIAYNTFIGGTKIYCNNIKTMHADITHNIYKSRFEAYCFQEYAFNGSLRFCYNKVEPYNITHKNLFLYKHYNTTFSPTVFDSAVIIGNDNSAINPAVDYSELQAHILFINNRNQ